MTQKKKAHPGHYSRARRSASRFWLVATYGTYQMEVLTVDCGDDEAMPVFSHEEEAELFLGLGEDGEGLRVRESSAGEIVSLLFGPCAGVGSVALDPSPMMTPEMIGLVKVSRDRFFDLTTAPGRKRARPGPVRVQIPALQNRLLFKNSNRIPGPFTSAGSKLLSRETNAFSDFVKRRDETRHRLRKEHA
jgi:hypothetical protein